MKVIELQISLEEHLRCLRSLVYLANGPEFEYALSDHLEKVNEYIRVITCDPSVLNRNRALLSLKEFIRKEYKGGESFFDLRDQARRLGVPCYSRLDKDGLRAGINARRILSDKGNLRPSVGDQNVSPQGQSDPKCNCVQT